MTSVGGPPYRIEFEITRDDLVDYLRLAQRTLNAVGVVGAVVAFSVAVLLVVFDEIPFGLLIAGLGLFWMISAGTPIVDRLRAGRVGRSIIGTPASFVVGEAGLEVVTATGSGHIPWSAITRVVEGPKMVFLKRDRLLVAWLPKRATSDEVLAYIRANVDRQALSAGQPGGPAVPSAN